MRTTICKQYHFEAAHRLPKVPDGHKCQNLHGHNYRVDVHLSGPVDWSGFVRDFADIDRAMTRPLEKVDHRFLNEVEGLENPTAEVIAAWFYQRLENVLPVSKIRVWETPECWAEVAK